MRTAAAVASGIQAGLIFRCGGQYRLPGCAVNVLAAPRRQPQLPVEADHEGKRLAELVRRAAGKPPGQDLLRRYSDHAGPRPGMLSQDGRANIAVVSMAMRKSPCVARSRSPVVAS